MKKKKSWFKPKGYIHLNQKYNSLEKVKSIKHLVKSPKAVATHAFFPLMFKQIPQRRYKVVGYTMDDYPKPIRGHKKVKSGKVESTKKLRPINYATHIDAHIYSYYASEILAKKYEQLLQKEPELSKCIIAYRRIKEENKESGKNNIHFAKEVFDEIKRYGNCTAFAFDIENFFSSLNHKYLKKIWCELLGVKSLPPDHFNLYKSITKFKFVKMQELRQKGGNFDEKKLAENRKSGVEAFFKSTKEFREAIKNGDLGIYSNDSKDADNVICGIPQGLAISAILANVYLLKFDQVMYKEIVEKRGGMYRRYSDDIVVICPNADVEEIEHLVINQIITCNLIISGGKTEICQFIKAHNDNLECVSVKKIRGEYVESQQGSFGYLGFEFNGKSILIKSKNLSKFYRRMKYQIKSKKKRLEIVSAKTGESEPPIFAKKLIRSFTSKGMKKRECRIEKFVLMLNEEKCYYEFTAKEVPRKYWGNFLGYANRANKIMGGDSIARQVRNHRKIFRRVMKKHLSYTE